MPEIKGQLPNIHRSLADSIGMTEAELEAKVRVCKGNTRSAKAIREEIKSSLEATKGQDTRYVHPWR